MPYLNPDLLNEAVIRMQHSKVSLYSGVIPSPSSLYKKADYGNRYMTLYEGGVRVCGDAVLRYFWCGFAVIFIFTRGIAVSKH